MRKYLFYFIPVLLLGYLVSCVRDDDEPPEREIKAFSRLYVSTSDYQAGAATSLENVWVIDPADEDEFPDEKDIKGYISAAKGGKVIHFSPLSDGMIFQGSMNAPGTLDTSIHILSVNKLGAVSTRAKLSNRRYDNVRGLFYTVVNSGQLNEGYLVAVNKSDSLANASMFMFKRPETGGYRPRFQMSLDYIPWGLTIDGKDVYVVKTGGQDAIVAYKGFTQNLVEKVDTNLVNILPSYSLTVAGAKNLRGISYSKAKDILVLTDYDVESNVIKNGRILVVEQFSTHNTTKSITPTRIIQGDATKLKQPMDVAIDTRADGKYMYVADAGSNLVLRYLIDDDGNVSPKGSLAFKGRSPQSISLDSR